MTVTKSRPWSTQVGPRNLTEYFMDVYAYKHVNSNAFWLLNRQHDSWSPVVLSPLPWSTSRPLVLYWILWALRQLRLRSDLLSLKFTTSHLASVPQQRPFRCRIETILSPASTGLLLSSHSCTVRYARLLHSFHSFNLRLVLTTTGGDREEDTHRTCGQMAT